MVCKRGKLVKSFVANPRYLCFCSQSLYKSSYLYRRSPSYIGALGCSPVPVKLPCLTAEMEEAAYCPKSASSCSTRWEETWWREETPLKCLLTEVLRRTGQVSSLLAKASSRLRSPSLLTAVGGRAAFEVRRQAKLGTRSRHGWGCCNIVVWCHRRSRRKHHPYFTVTVQLLCRQLLPRLGELHFLPDGLWSCCDILGDSLNICCDRTTHLQTVWQKVTFDSLPKLCTALTGAEDRPPNLFLSEE